MEMTQLILLILQGKATEKQLEDVQLWLKENEENYKVYQEISMSYYRLTYTDSWTKIDSTEALNKVKRQVGRQQRMARVRYWYSGVVAILVLALGVFMLNHQVIKMNSNEIVVTLEQSGGKKAMLTLADGRTVILKDNRSIDINLSSVQLVEDSLLGLVYNMKDSVATVLEHHRLSVPRAGEYIMTLSDGTKVWLNSETEIRYPVVFGEDKREVFITGEAFFDVRKDAHRPFIVYTPNAQTTVLGTSFNVKAYKEEGMTEITLVSGMVDVEAGEHSCRIQRGQQVIVDNGSLKLESREVDAAFYSSWKDGLFDFDQMSLSELCVKLGRWYDVDFFFVNQSAARKRFTGAVKRNNSLQFILDFIEKTSNVRFEVNGKAVSVYNQ